MSNRSEANRLNAKKSTGPKTPGGRLKSARNATKHGLSSSLTADFSSISGVGEPLRQSHLVKAGLIASLSNAALNRDTEATRILLRQLQVVERYERRARSRLAKRTQ